MQFRQPRRKNIYEKQNIFRSRSETIYKEK